MVPDTGPLATEWPGTTPASDSGDRSTSSRPPSTPLKLGGRGPVRDSRSVVADVVDVLVAVDAALAVVEVGASVEVDVDVVVETDAETELVVDVIDAAAVVKVSSGPKVVPLALLATSR